MYSHASSCCSSCKYSHESYEYKFPTVFACNARWIIWIVAGKTRWHQTDMDKVDHNFELEVTV